MKLPILIALFPIFHFTVFFRKYKAEVCANSDGIKQPVVQILKLSKIYYQEKPLL